MEYFPARDWLHIRASHMGMFCGFTSLSAEYFCKYLTIYWNDHAHRMFRSMETEPFPYPGTPAARRHGCICPDQCSGADVGSLSKPWVLDVNCPLHGETAYEEHKKGPRH
jgi:hypothetical protein